jgi:protein phosphatase
LDREANFFLLADGMGGHERGAEASEIALKSIQEFLHPEIFRQEIQDITGGSGVPAEIVCLSSLVDKAINKANAILFERNEKAGFDRYMGTTVVGLVPVDGGTYMLWFHVGDSRLYLWKDAALQCLTTDHSAYEEWVRQGKTGEEPVKHIITRAVGPKAGVVAEIGWNKRERGDLYILCSDGLTDMISEDQIVSILKKESDIDTIASQLIEAANTAGGRDNVSTVVCRV